MCALTQSCLTLCDHMDCSLPGSSVHGIFQARKLDRVAISYSRGSSRPRDQIPISCIAGRFFTTTPAGKPNVSEGFLGCTCMLSCSVVSDSLQPHGLQPARLLRPATWEAQDDLYLDWYLSSILHLDKI